ncbi:hypothetical protein XNC1_3243 [Xenorhabdus nematophila ATCC 19061]|uniref:Uncharacterized protein n=1 Tax=Xenorhabdus nematophila (strain ATCC 19061 / DSM 3370 / CCUG 14189 / LMG 1036 / NCIMB 9965 / AN6) TaxID=406817 RepID=D3VLG9_XENNA|nr:hypothetical protein XNC1_3243 [Xenorhabdus nematophila ATCC 19061]CEE91171.1 hypothetical protein XNA1_1980031 [Xenorhabdus nematophila str. Anatoliense]CEF32792.1 hypothetical protein XNW1_4530004 [Xenorhabdus nematophila str. Websteri]CEK24114.1 hypothetical protein XNC2_3120 [Xenorhabdus nematophila AN6/1]
MEIRQSANYEEFRTLITSIIFQYSDTLAFNILGADFGFDGIRETQGACRGAVGLVKSRKTIVANDENYALAA